jgi:hypothetical protein
LLAEIPLVLPDGLKQFSPTSTGFRLVETELAAFDGFWQRQTLQASDIGALSAENTGR